MPPNHVPVGCVGAAVASNAFPEVGVRAERPDDTVAFPGTRATLFARLRDPSDIRAGREFVLLYGPMVYRVAGRWGIEDADAAELMREVLQSFVGSARAPNRSTFREWLLIVTHDRVRDFLAARNTRPTPANGPSRDPGRGDEWERDYQRGLAAWGLRLVRPEFGEVAWEAFWGTAVEGRSAESVGTSLAMKTGAVLVAKCRVLARLADVVARLRAETDVA